MREAGKEAAAASSSSDKTRLPLKTILQNFLNHVDSLETRKRAGDDAYDQEFQVSYNYYRYFRYCCILDQCDIFLKSYNDTLLMYGAQKLYNYAIG